jgi:hypothetical protein
MSKRYKVHTAKLTMRRSSQIGIHAVDPDVIGEPVEIEGEPLGWSRRRADRCLCRTVEKTREGRWSYPQSTNAGQRQARPGGRVPCGAGTADMIRRAERAGVPVRQVEQSS